MGRADFLRLGDWNTVDYQSGFKRKASTMVRNWQGYWVAPENNEPRQPQYFARGIPENPTPPWVQPWPSVTYTYTNQQIGIGDGVTTQFQAGDGIYNVTITAVEVAGAAATYTATAVGLITITSGTPATGAVVSASFTETAP